MKIAHAILGLQQGLEPCAMVVASRVRTLQFPPTIVVNVGRVEGQPKLIRNHASTFANVAGVSGAFCAQYRVRKTYPSIDGSSLHETRINKSARSNFVRRSSSR